MGNPTGRVEIQIQPEDLLEQTKASSSVSPPGSGGSFIGPPGWSRDPPSHIDTSIGFDTSISLDSVVIDRNYDDFYLNPDLESLLNKRGFSTQRSEILGMFNYLAPLTQDGTGTPTVDPEYIITSAGELFDYQCQLKQLRYSDALGFFTKMLGFSLESSESGQILVANDAMQRFYLDSYDTQMSLAKDVLDYLALIYNAISAFIDAQQVKYNTYNIFKTLDETGDIIVRQSGQNNSLHCDALIGSNKFYNSLLLKLPMPDVSYVQLAEGFNSADQEFKSLMKDTLGLDDEWINKSSNTTMMFQLLHYCLAGFIGTGHIHSGDLSSVLVDRNGLYGINRFTSDSENILSNNVFRSFEPVYLEWSGGNGGDVEIQDSLDISGYYISTDEIVSLLRDDQALSSISSMGVETENAFTANMIYLSGIDYLQGGVMSKKRSSSGKIANVSANNITGDSQMEDLISATVGRDITVDMSSILSNLPAEGVDGGLGTLTRQLLPKNKDTATLDERVAIESYTSTNYRLAEGVETTRSGRSYYCDEIATHELDEVKGRISDLRNHLGNVAEYLENYSELIAGVTVPENAGSAIASMEQNGYVMTDKVDDSTPAEYPVLPSTFFHVIINKLRLAAKKQWGKNLSLGGEVPDSIFEFWLPQLIAAMATEDDEILRLLVAYLFAKDDYHYGGNTTGASDSEIESTFVGIAAMLQDAVVSKSADDWFCLADEKFAAGTSTYGFSYTYGSGKQTNDQHMQFPYIVNHQKLGWDVSSDVRFYPLDSFGKVFSFPSDETIEDSEMRQEIKAQLFSWTTPSESWSDIGTTTFLDYVIKAAVTYEDIVQRTENVKNEDNSEHTARGLTRKSRILAALRVSLVFWKKMLRCGWYLQSKYVDGDAKCFVAGTLITMSDGSQKPIEDVETGDILLGQDGSFNTVLSYDRSMLEDRHLYAFNGKDPFVTSEHPFMTLSGWASINPDALVNKDKKLYDELQPDVIDIGSAMVKLDGIEVVETLQEFKSENQQLYNFSLDGNHTYFANGYLVHNKTGYNVGGTTSYALFEFNSRSLRSFIDASVVFSHQGAIEDSGGGTDEDLLLVDDSFQFSDGTSLLDNEKYKSGIIYDPITDWGGEGDEMLDMVQEMLDIYKECLAKEKRIIGSFYMAASCLDQLDSAAANLYSVIETNTLGAQQFDEALEAIKSDPDFQSAALLSITRDQLTCCRALYDSFSVPNREYPYLPASKAIMTNQSKNLAGVMKEPQLLEDDSGIRKFIMPVGLTAGLLESLRTRMMDETGDLTYRYSNLVEISVWKRNLLNESQLFEPQRYVFDTSRFVIVGRPEATAVGSDYIDGDQEAPSPQTVDEVLSTSVIRQYTPDGNIATFTGKAYENSFENEEQNVSSEAIFINHVIEHQMKVFMRLTTGFDTGEDVFPFLEGNVFFDGPDSDKQATYDELAEQAKEMFVDRDVEATLNYDRLIGELSRSIVLSPEKYRNRIIYPKVFERVFCVFIDPDSFIEIDVENSSWWEELFESYVDATRDALESAGSIEKPLTSFTSEYSQYYVTIALKPSLESDAYTVSESSEEESVCEYYNNYYQGWKAKFESYGAESVEHMIDDIIDEYKRKLP